MLCACYRMLSRGVAGNPFIALRIFKVFSRVKKARARNEIVKVAVHAENKWLQIN